MSARDETSNGSRTSDGHSPRTAADCSTSTRTPATTAACSRWSGDPQELADTVLAGARVAVDAHRHARPRRRAPLHRRARRGPDRLPDRGGPGERPGRGAGGRQPARGGARAAGVPLRGAGHGARAPGALVLSRGRHRRARRAHAGRRAGAGLRARRDAPDRRAPRWWLRGRRWSRSTSSSTRADVDVARVDRGRACASATAGCPACGRSASRSEPGEDVPGLHQRARPVPRAAAQRWSRRVREEAAEPRHGHQLRRARRPGARRRARGLSRSDLEIRGFDERRHVLEHAIGGTPRY